MEGIVEQHLMQIWKGSVETQAAGDIYNTWLPRLWYIKQMANFYYILEEQKRLVVIMYLHGTHPKDIEVTTEISI